MSQKGFTLIEMMVAVALFSVVMLVSIGALLSLVDAGRRAQAVQSVMNNLNVALDSMVRSLRMGQRYTVAPDGKSITFAPYGVSPDSVAEYWTYYFEETMDASGEMRGRLWKEYVPKDFARSVDVPLTASEVDIDYLRFFKTEDMPGDAIQPRVFMVVSGQAGYDKVQTTTSFNIQASATQRLLDL